MTSLPPLLHSCLPHLARGSHLWTEHHGFTCGPFEHGEDVWWQCEVCHEKYEDDELRWMFHEEGEDPL